MWVVLGTDTVVYLLSPSRGHEVPQSHFGPEASGVLEVDRYSGYKAMSQVKSGLIVLAFCWAHVRRDFVAVGKSWSESTPWALSWLRRIRRLYQINRELLCHRPGSTKVYGRFAFSAFPARVYVDSPAGPAFSISRDFK